VPFFVVFGVSDFSVGKVDAGTKNRSGVWTGAAFMVRPTRRIMTDDKPLFAATRHYGHRGCIKAGHPMWRGLKMCQASSKENSAWPVRRRHQSVSGIASPQKKKI